MRITKSKSNFELAPAGNHLALITTVADLGFQKTSWNGETKYFYKLGITYELAGKKTSEGKPFAVFDTVKVSLHEKSRLCNIVQAALGVTLEELDPKDLLGKPFLVQVVHRTDGQGRTWANIGAVTPLPDGMKAPETGTPLLYFDLEQPDAEVFQKLPALFKKRIEQRVQEEKKPEPRQPDSDFDQDIAY
jgi:hypothetical protein